jgi:hypothetical protein
MHDLFVKTYLQLSLGSLVSLLNLIILFHLLQTVHDYSCRPTNIIRDS